MVTAMGRLAADDTVPLNTCTQPRRQLRHHSPPCLTCATGASSPSSPSPVPLLQAERITHYFESNDHAHEILRMH